MRELVFRRGVCQRWRGWAGDATDAAFRSLPCEFSAVSGVSYSYHTSEAGHDFRASDADEKASLFGREVHVRPSSRGAKRYVLQLFVRTPRCKLALDSWRGRCCRPPIPRAQAALPSLAQLVPGGPVRAMRARLRHLSESQFGSSGIPSLRGVMHDCAGKATAETCILSGGARGGRGPAGGSVPGGRLVHAGPAASDMQPVRRRVASEGLGSNFHLNGLVKGNRVREDLPVVEPAACADPDFGEGTPKPYRCQANATANAVQIEQLTDAILCDNSTNSTSNDTSSGRRLQSATCFAGSVQTVGLSVESFTHDCTGKVHDDACVAHCSLGWNMTETEPSIFLCDNGYLVGAALPTCTPLPCTFAFPNALGLLHTCDGVRTGETCLATCTEVGYDYSAGWAAETFTCLPTGSVTGQSPTCFLAFCRSWMENPRGRTPRTGLRYQDTCDVGCGQGYTLSGSSSRRQCEADGSFSGGLPTCVGNPCNMGLPNNPTVNASGCNGLTTGESCEVTCLPGFLLGNSSLTCHPSGYLLGVVPTCTPSPCPDIALPASLQSTCSGNSDEQKCWWVGRLMKRFWGPVGEAHTCDGIGFGAACFAFCDAGYESTGARSESWQCTGSSAGPTVPGAMEMQGVGLRGLALSCSPLPCIFNLPLGAQYAHNCSNVTTGR
ncbi:CUB and sushi domain-containing protein 2 (CUB and sushi multiple domains protein 2) [Durusdinium trenchii]|uniref:CUB and sushi domain-containing protein 2 (CUB and sushi multiple domains protein 2) n=1 Tax=Durusdinium trenchii TaxID=1381693 RepID=A0ABP0KRQ3_9DINO